MSFIATMQFVWPVLIAAAAWGIAIWALREPDVHSDVVRQLVGSKSERSIFEHLKTNEEYFQNQNDRGSYDKS